MLSATHVTPTVKVNDDVSVTSSCWRSSASCDGNDKGPSSLTRSRSLRGSTLLLEPGMETGAPHWSRESIVEALEKKCRENVSSRLRSQLPQHLQKLSTTACTDLPVIVRAASSTLSRPSTPAGLSPVRSASQLYQAVSHGGSPLYDSGRRHSTISTAAGTSDHLSRSLSLSRGLRRGSDDSGNRTSSSALVRASASRGDSDCASNTRASVQVRLHPARPPRPDFKHQSASSVTNRNANQPAGLPTTLLYQSDEPRPLRQGPDDLLDQSQNTSAWSLIRDDQNWAAGRRATTLPAKLQPSYDVQQMIDMRGELPTRGDYVGSSSSVDTDTTADCDVTPDSDDSCDDVSVKSFTFSRSTSQTHELSASSATRLDHLMTAGSGARSKDDTNSMASTSQSTKPSLQVTLTDRILTNGSLVRSDVMGSGGTRDVHSENAQLNETDADLSSNTRSRLNNDQPLNGQYTTVDVGQMVLMPRPTSIKNTKSASQSEVASAEEDRSCDIPRYRTSISLSIGSSSASASATTTKLLYRSRQQQQQEQSYIEPSQLSASNCEDCRDLSPSLPPQPPPSAQRDVAVSRTSDCDDEENDRMNGELTSSRLGLPGYRRLCSGHSDDVKAEDNRVSDKPEKLLTNSDAVMKSSQINVTPVAAARGRDMRYHFPRRRVSGVYHVFVCLSVCFSTLYLIKRCNYRITKLYIDMADHESWKPILGSRLKRSRSRRTKPCRCWSWRSRL